MTNLFISFIKVSTFSGQTASTELIKKVLSDGDYSFQPIYLYPFKRTQKNVFLSILDWIFKTISVTPSVVKLLFSKKPILYINLGQGYFSFFRVLWWYLPIRLLRWNLPVIFSLHGHSFVKWDIQSPKTILFKRILNSAKIITVLGDSQAACLVKFGVIRDKIKFIPNTIDSEFIPLEQILKKQKLTNTPLQVLFLSLLVESKGYPEYLEALYHIAKTQPQLKINAILCGPITKTAFCTRFAFVEDAKHWIEDMVAKINAVPDSQITVKWINGARGKEKQALYDVAQVFVLPTSYPNEAQPLVLLEAMAAGCALITTGVGEIPSTVSQNEAIILNPINAYTIADAIVSYAIDEQKRIDKVVSGWNLVNDKFSLKLYKKNWSQLFQSCYERD
ncbi:glycosyltransferase family 4 protein [Flavobacterium paronense]|uniref:Glycosyltransferase family 4 protein n=1 Tax=Flavobacterium paronense TaxID=1392775 RepID=A0ABV5GAQ7_9FLAO|nr:glycosyltransferase family 4 protein [Flavobacterium paronense]MDN3676681.1 glycosyltransferase family 4 protein [Flavobacterium paronense]